MPTYPSQLQPGNGSYIRLGRSPSSPPSLPCENRSHGQRESSQMEIDLSLTIDLGALVNVAGRLRSSLPPSYRWLGQENLKIVGSRPIDAGGFADVWVGEMGGRKVAVKSYRCYASMNHLPIYQRFYREALACTRLSDERVVPFIGIYSTRKHPFALVFEYMEHLNLGEYLRNNLDVGKLGLLLGITRTIKGIHNLNVVHGNIKITNILVDNDGHVYIAGLGAASIPSTMPGVEVDRFFHGAAPELVDPQRFKLVSAEATAASDVYAFGVLAWEVFSGRVPFHDKSKVAGVFSISNGRRPSRPHHPELSDHVWNMIKGCWEGNPARRKTIAEVVAILEAELNKVK